ncbi:MAG: type VII toxin-antitoxin system HepT family RNase toxin [Egibacteraceae bacterium]
MVDAVRLARLLQRLGEQLAILRSRAAEDPEALRADEARLSGTKYRLVTAIEAVLDIAHHLLASELWGPAEDSADAVRLLGRHGVIEAEIAARLARATGFRNVLVHGYTEVDDDIVVASLDELDDLQVFIDQVRSWAATQDL